MNGSRSVIQSGLVGVYIGVVITDKALDSLLIMQCPTGQFQSREVFSYVAKPYPEV